MQSGIDSVIRQSGLENTEDVQKNARWLVESGIELTPQNLSYLSDLSQLQFQWITASRYDSDGYEQWQTAGRKALMTGGTTCLAAGKRACGAG